MIKDTVKQEPISTVKPPVLKGHIKLTLRNAKTGEIEKVSEGDNLITNAVADIFANNSCGMINYTKLSPLWQKWYGGILCYQQAHADVTDPTKYGIVKSSDNPITAHAGQTVYTGADDMSRGSPLTDSQSLIIGEDYVKQTWEWGTQQGNGWIRALSLTHADTGDAGLGSTSTAFQSFNPIATIQVDGYSAVQSARANGNAFARYDDNHTVFFYIGEPDWYAYNSYPIGSFTGVNDVTVYVRRFGYDKYGLCESNVGRIDEQRVFKVTTSVTFFAQPSYAFDPTTKYLWLFSNMTARNAFSTSVMNYTVIDCVNETEVTHGTFTNDSYTTNPYCPTGGRDNTSGNYIFRKDNYMHLIKDGNYIYLPLGDGRSEWGSGDPGVYHKGFLKLNTTNASDQTPIVFPTVSYYFRPAMKCGDMIACWNNVINGSTAYTCGAPDAGNNKTLINEPTKISSFTSRMSLPMYDGTAIDRWIVANKLVNTSLYNLDSPAQKLSSQRMTIEYTLTETTPT